MPSYPPQGTAIKPHAPTHSSGGSDEVSLDASQITSGRFPLSRLPDIESGYILEGQGTGVDMVAVNPNGRYTPAGHKTSHEPGGTDQITSLSLTSLDMNSNPIDNVGEPASSNQAATKNYVDTNCFTKLAEAVLTANATSLSVSFTAKRFLRVLIYLHGFDDADLLRMRFNGDAGNNYAFNVVDFYYDGTTVTSDGARIPETSPVSSLKVDGVNSSIYPRLIELLIFNESDKIKRISGKIVWGYARNVLVAGKWINTTAQITSIEIYGINGNNLLAGTRIIVFGVD